MRRGSGVGAWAVRALEREDLMDDVEIFDIRCGANWDLYQRGDVAASRELSLTAIRAGIPPSQNHSTSAHVCAATASMGMGDMDSAMRIYAEGIHGVEGHPDPEYGHAALLAARAMNLSAMGRFEEARADAESSTALARRVRNPTVLALAALARGWALKSTERAAARAAFEESIAICESGAIQGTLVPALAFVAPLRLEEGDPVGALDALRSSIVHCRETGERFSAISVLDSFVTVLTELDDLEPPVVVAGVLRAELFGPMAAVTGPDLENQEQHLAIARAGLSDAAYEAALARGGSMSDEDAIEYVIGELDRVLAEQQGVAG